MEYSNVSTAFSRSSARSRTQKVKEPVVRGSPFLYEMGGVRLIHVKSQRTSIIITHGFDCVFYEPGPILKVTNCRSFNSHNHLVWALSQEIGCMIHRSQLKKMEAERGYGARPRSHISSAISGIQTQSLPRLHKQRQKTKQKTVAKNSHGDGVKSLGL